MGILRLVLALSVVIAHSNPIFGFELVGGFIAVKAFYIISGFYMSLILNEKYINSYYLFITNRFMRLFPIYWCILVLSILFSIIVHTDKTDLYINYFHNMNIGSIFFLSFTNIFLFFQDIVMFLGLDKVTGALFFTADFHNTDPKLYQFLLIPQAWTIGVELLFYLIAPFLVRRKLKYIILLILISLFLRIYLYSIGLNRDPWSYRFFPTELLFFLLGNISYRIYKKILTIEIQPIYINIILTLLLIFTVFYSFTFFSQKEYVYYLGIFISIPFTFHRTKNLKIDSYIGELSYPIYMCHILLLNCLIVLKIPKLNGGYGILLIIASILFSIILNELVSKRIERKRQQRIQSADK